MAFIDNFLSKYIQKPTQQTTKSIGSFLENIQNRVEEDLKQQGQAMPKIQENPLTKQTLNVVAPGIQSFINGGFKGYANQMATAKAPSPETLVMGFMGGGFDENVAAGEDLSKLSPYSLKRTGIDSVFHETSPQSAREIVFADMDKSGLNVATSPDLALGQSGKGVKIEIDSSKLEGRKIIKPTSKFIELQTGKYPEYQLYNSPSKLEKYVKNITFEQPLTTKGESRFFGLRDNWIETKQILPDGSVQYTNPNFFNK